MSPETLTHIVYVILVVFFCGVMAFMFLYNIRMRNREREIARSGKRPDSQEQLMIEAQHSFRRHNR